MRISQVKMKAYFRTNFVRSAMNTLIEQILDLELIVLLRIPVMPETIGSVEQGDRCHSLI
jgi:hypothetical protein